MFGKLPARHIPHSWKLFLGLLCVALVVLSGTLSVTHAHAQGDITHADCGLCVAVHMAAQLVSPAPLPPVARVFTCVEASRPIYRPQAHFASNLFTRPPPVDALLS